MTFRQLGVCLLLGVFSCAQAAHAQPRLQAVPAPEAIPPGDSVIVPVKKGQGAPFDGQLYSPETALRWANWLQQYRLSLRLQLELDQKLCAVDTALLGRKLALEQEARLAERGDLTARLTRLQKENLETQLQLHNPPWYTHPALVFSLGVVLSSLVYGLLTR